MVYDFRTDENSEELTLPGTHAYIWSLKPAEAKFHCYTLTAGHEEVLEWINSLDSDKDRYLDALRAFLLVFSVTDGQIVPRQFQLSAGLAAHWGKNSIVNAGTGSGKTLSMAIPLLMDLEAVAIIISPLKRLQITQAEALQRFLIKVLVINQDVELSPLEIQGIKKGAYNAIIVSPEQLFTDSAGATPRLLSLIHKSQSFVRSIKHLFIDEGHELFFSGIDRHGISAFRPSYGELDKIIPKLPNKTTIHVLSATFPPHVRQVVKTKLLGSRETTCIQLPLNRRNIVYTTRIIDDLGNYKNLSFLIPLGNPDSRPSGVIIFFESSVRADDASSYLNNSFRTLHPMHKTKRIAASYHAGLSQTCLTRVFQQFCGSNPSEERIDILCATSCGATGIDYPNVKVVIQYGMCPDLCSLIQRAGRAARTPGTEALFIYMAEKWIVDKRIDQQSNTYLEDPDTPVRISSVGNSKNKQWVGMASVAFANSRSCLRREFAKYLGDKSGDCAYSTRWCCDRHHEKIDFMAFGLGDFWDGKEPRQWRFINVSFGAEGGDCERTASDRKGLAKSLVEWRQTTYSSDRLNVLYSAQDIITEEGIRLVAKMSPSRLRRDGPNAIVKELSETCEWGTRYAGEIFEHVWKHDHDDIDPVPTYEQ